MPNKTVHWSPPETGWSVEDLSEAPYPFTVCILGFGSNDDKMFHEDTVVILSGATKKWASAELENAVHAEICLPLIDFWRYYPGHQGDYQSYKSVF